MHITCLTSADIVELRTERTAFRILPDPTGLCGPCSRRPLVRCCPTLAPSLAARKQVSHTVSIRILTISRFTQNCVSAAMMGTPSLLLNATAHSPSGSPHCIRPRSNLRRRSVALLATQIHFRHLLFLREQVQCAPVRHTELGVRVCELKAGKAAVCSFTAADRKFLI